ASESVRDLHVRLKARQWNGSREVDQAIIDFDWAGFQAVIGSGCRAGWCLGRLTRLSRLYRYSDDQHEDTRQVGGFADHLRAGAGKPHATRVNRLITGKRA